MVNFDQSFPFRQLTLDLTPQGSTASIRAENAGCAPPSSNEMEQRMVVIKRRHFTHTKTFEERLAEESCRFKEAQITFLSVPRGNYFCDEPDRLRRPYT